MINYIAKLVTMLIPIKKVRRRIRKKLTTFIYGFNLYKKAKFIGENLIVGNFSYCNRNTIIGNNVRLNQVNIIGDGECEIKDNCQFATEVLIITQNHNYDNGTQIPYDNTYICKKVEIDANVWCGARVTILPGTKIGEGAVIQAGSVVHGEIPPCAVIGGNPAKVFKYRNVEHYNQLKSEEKFLTENY